MEEKLTVTYRGITITISDDWINSYRDKVSFKVNGRERSADSVGEAKKIIDKALDTVKKTFQPINAISFARKYDIDDENTEYHKIKITNLFVKSGYIQARVSGLYGFSSNCLEALSRFEDEIYADTPGNEKIAEKIKKLSIKKREYIKKIDEEVKALFNSLENIELPDKDELEVKK